MADPELFDVDSFTPFQGGRGVNMSVTDSSSASAIPGTSPSQDAFAKVLVQNYGDNICFVRFGQSAVSAATSTSMCILPGVPYVFTIPSVKPDSAYIAAICPSGLTTSLSVMAGDGS